MVDGAYCAVRFPHAGEHGDTADMLKTCRLMRKNDLQVVKTGHLPKQPETLQREPKKLLLPQQGWLLDMAVNGNGLQLLVESSRLRLVTLSLDKHVHYFSGG